MKKSELSSIESRHESVPVTMSGQINMVDDVAIQAIAQKAHDDREALLAEVKRLRAGLSAIVNLQELLPRSVVREACYEVLNSEAELMPNQSPLAAELSEARARIEFLEKFIEDTGIDRV